MQSSVLERSINGLTSGGHYTVRVLALTYNNKKSKTATTLDAIVGKFRLFVLIIFSYRGSDYRTLKLTYSK